MAAETKENPYLQWQWKILGATWVAYAGYYFGRKAFFAVKAKLGAELHLGVDELAYLGIGYFVFYAIGQFSSAYFGRRLGPRLLLLVGIGITFVCNFVFGIGNGFYTFLLFLCLNGLAQGTGWPGCIGSLAYWLPRKHRGKILGGWSTCYQVGSIVASIFAGFLADAAGWRWSFFGGSLVLLAVWATVLLLHPDTPEKQGLKPLPEDEGKVETSGPGWTGDIVTTVVLMGAIYFCIKFLRYLIWSWAPYLLELNFQQTTANANYLTVIFDACGFAGVIFAGYVSDRIFKGRRAMVSVLMLVGMVLGFLLLYTWGAHSLLYFSISLGIIGFMLFGPDSLISGVGAIDAASQKTALAAAGIINGMGSLGPVAQELFFAYLYDGKSIAPVLAMLVIISAAAAGLTFLLWMRSRKGKATV